MLDSLRVKRVGLIFFTRVIYVIVYLYSIIRLQKFIVDTEYVRCFSMVVMLKPCVMLATYKFTCSEGIQLAGLKDLQKTRFKIFSVYLVAGEIFVS